MENMFVKTIEEARQAQFEHNVELFLYPAHSPESFLVTDLRLLEKMKQVAEPAHQYNSWYVDETMYSELLPVVEPRIRMVKKIGGVEKW